MLKRNLIANYLIQGWVALMNFAFITLYIKYLSIESYGLIALFANCRRGWFCSKWGFFKRFARRNNLFIAFPTELCCVASAPESPDHCLTG